MRGKLAETATLPFREDAVGWVYLFWMTVLCRFVCSGGRGCVALFSRVDVDDCVCGFVARVGVDDCAVSLCLLGWTWMTVSVALLAAVASQNRNNNQQSACDFSAIAQH